MAFRMILTVVYAIFKEGRPLFLWFCALIMALEISILRSPKLRAQMVAALVVTLISMVIVGILYFYKLDFLNLIQHFLRNVLKVRFLARPILPENKFLYALINFAIIAVFWIDTFRRWINSARGKPIDSRIDIGLGAGKPTAGPDDDSSSAARISLQAT